MTGEVFRLKIAWGSFDNERGIWYPNENLALSVEEQRNQNFANGCLPMRRPLRPFDSQLPDDFPAALTYLAAKDFNPSWADTKSAELTALSRRERRLRIGMAWAVIVGLSVFVGWCIWLAN